MKRIRLVILTSTLLLLIIGIGAVQAIKLMTKGDQIKLKQEMIPQDREEATSMVGIFAPGFEKELAEAKALYAKEYGEGNFQVLTQNGYTLLVPPGMNPDAITDAKAQIESDASAAANNAPNAAIQASQIAKIRDVFGTDGAITYQAALGAYTDEKGFQYNFKDGDLIGKQIGITSALNIKFEKAYPHLAPGVPRTANISSEQARANADQAVNKLFGLDRAAILMASVKSDDFGDARMVFVYGNNEVNVLVDQVTGDIINLNIAI